MPTHPGQQDTRDAMGSVCRVMACVIAAGLLAGCATTPVKNYRLPSHSEDRGYRYRNLSPGPCNSDSLLVLLTFSGGGTRAASLSYGVLEKLRDTRITWEGYERSLLHEVDVISSVSGGSLTSAYYGAFGDGIFEDYAEEVLYQDIQGRLIEQFLAIRNFFKLVSPFYNRTDLLAQEFDKKIFERKRFGDLGQDKRRPFIIINATDVSLGSNFTFTQDQFDLLYSDLNRFPLGHAVAASAAFPGLLTPMTLRNYTNGPDYVLPEWVDTAMVQLDRGSYGRLVAEHMLSYVEPGRPFIHLADGGVSDNLGIMPIMRMLRGSALDSTLLDSIDNGRVKKAVIITVNAKRRPSVDWDRRREVLRLLEVLRVATDTPVGNFTQGQIEYLKLYIDHLTAQRRIREEVEEELWAKGIEVDLSQPERSAVDYHFIEVAFDRLADPAEEAYLNEVPTSFKLPKDDVDRLRAAACTILDKHPGFQELLAELEQPREGDEP